MNILLIIIGLCTRCHKTHIYNNSLFKMTHNGLFCKTCLCPSCTEPLDRNVSWLCRYDVLRCICITFVLHCIGLSNVENLA